MALKAKRGLTKKEEETVNNLKLMLKIQKLEKNDIKKTMNLMRRLQIIGSNLLQNKIFFIQKDIIKI